MTKTEWDKIEPLFDQRSTWLLIPGRREAYVPLFEGTLNEATAEALKHATFWETTTTIYHAPGGRGPGEKTPVAKVSPVPGSPLKR